MATLFSKFLTEIDITRSSSIPTSSMGLIHIEEGDLIDMHVHDDCCRLWIFRCSVQQNGNTGVRALSTDWLESVLDRNVKVGDKVIFIEETSEDQALGAKIKIEMKRKIRLFGQDIWADAK